LTVIVSPPDGCLTESYRSRWAKAPTFLRDRFFSPVQPLQFWPVPACKLRNSRVLEQETAGNITAGGRAFLPPSFDTSPLNRQDDQKHLMLVRAHPIGPEQVSLLPLSPSSQPFSTTPSPNWLSSFFEEYCPASPLSFLCPCPLPPPINLPDHGVASLFSWYRLRARRPSDPCIEVLGSLASRTKKTIFFGSSISSRLVYRKCPKCSHGS